MKLLLIAIVLMPSVAFAQTTPYGPFPNGMRVVVGSNGILVRDTPNYGLCIGTPPHACIAGDALPSGTYGVIQSDLPVLDAGNAWYWSRVTFDGNRTGWVSAVPPFLNPLNPIQMNAGVSFQLVADYNGPALTNAMCLIDGLSVTATRQLVASSAGQQGTLLCPASAPGIGNHKVVIQAVNSVGTAASTEFQYVVGTAPISPPPSAPMSLRIQ